jgi:hypothetical protein
MIMLILTNSFVIVNFLVVSEEGFIEERVFILSKLIITANLVGIFTED